MRWLLRLRGAVRARRERAGQSAWAARAPYRSPSVLMRACGRHAVLILPHSLRRANCVQLRQPLRWSAGGVRACRMIQLLFALDSSGGAGGSCGLRIGRDSFGVIAANLTMYAQLLLVALVLVAVATADTCTCSGCKGITTKDCTVHAGDQEPPSIELAQGLKGQCPGTTKCSAGASTASCTVCASSIDRKPTELLQASKLTCPNSGCNSACKSLGCSKTTCK